MVAAAVSHPSRAKAGAVINKPLLFNSIGRESRDGAGLARLRLVEVSAGAAG